MYSESNAFLFNSGMSALSGAIHTLAQRATHIITFDVIYRKTQSLIIDLCEISHREHINLTFTPGSISLLASEIQSDNVLFVIEAPSNPFLRIIDIELIKAEFPNALIIIDFTLAGLLNGEKYIQYADIAVTSCTKYISGHNDLIAGLAIVNNDCYAEHIWKCRSTNGTIIDPIASYFLLRSLRTYDLRITKMLCTTNAILEMISASNVVDKIYYPGFGDDLVPNNWYKKFFSHGGSVLTFSVKQGVEVRDITEEFNVIKMAPSFGSVDSLYKIPRYMSRGADGNDFNYDSDSLNDLILSPSLIRLSVGCEPVESLSSDLSKLFGPI
jgi:cystathionine beta-lyase/cystathionine gamma-synthase